ncbi:MAG: FtsX-like permease family protein, partial [Candidatus Poribacteria bacterium]
MTFWRLITRGLRFYWRNHIGVMLCIAISTAVILGALVVGDSVRYSLKKIALSRLGEIQLALASQDHYFRTELADELEAELGNKAVSAILLGGIAINNENNLRANNIQVFGIDEKFWKLGNIDINLKENAVINERLAKQLGVKNGEEILIKVEKTSLLPLDAPLSVDTDLSASLRVTIKEIMPDLSIAGFSLQTNQIAPFNVFVPIQKLQEKIDLKGKANLLLIGDNKNNKVFKSPLIPLSKGGNLGADLSKGENLSDDLSKGRDLKAPLEKGGRGDFDANSANSALKKQWQFADIGLELNPIPELGMCQLTTKRIFIDQPIESVMKEISPDYIGVLTYLVNEIRLGDLATPYSMLSAIDPKAIMPNLKDDEIVINQWLADDIEAKVRDRIKLSYFVFDNQRRLYEKSTEFRITAIVPISGIFADKTLMPEFPGLANVESSRDWEPGIPIDLSKIRDKDEDYWHKYRGTPKGFITLKAGQAIWGNRFGSLTAIRYPLNANTIKFDSMIKLKLDPESVGLSFQPIRERAILSSKPTTDFGQLFFGLSIFLIFSSCLLAGLVFVFGVQQRREEIGTLLAIGFKAKQIRRLFLTEGFFIALCGGILGVILGIAYTKAVLFALSNIWQNAISATNLQYHAEPLTLLGGLFAGIEISMFTIWLTFRRQSKHT